MRAPIAFAVAAAAMLTACSPREQPAETVASAEVASDIASSEAYSLPAADYASPARNLGCDWPVTKTDTANSLLARFKTYAEIAPVLTYEGDTPDGVVIYGSDPRRRIEVLFKDEARTQVERIIIRSDSQWSGIQGLHLGSTIEAVEAANKKPFEFSGFGWEYGGYVHDFHGGKLGHQSRCTYNFRLGIPEAREAAGPVSEAVYGNRMVFSNAADVRDAAPVVTEIWISWPEPKPDAEESE